MAETVIEHACSVRVSPWLMRDVETLRRAAADIEKGRVVAMADGSWAELLEPEALVRSFSEEARLSRDVCSVTVVFQWRTLIVAPGSTIPGSAIASQKKNGHDFAQLTLNVDCVALFSTPLENIGYDGDWLVSIVHVDPETGLYCGLAPAPAAKVVGARIANGAGLRGGPAGVSVVS